MAEAVKEVNVTRQELIAACKHDLNMLAGVLIPHVATVPFPAYYNLLFRLFTELDNENREKLLRFCLGLPRGHAKTTFVKLLICWCILYDAFFFILIVCANEALATNALEDIDSMLSSPQAVNTWGEWKGFLTRDTKQLKRGPHHGQDKILAALGAQTSLRGINIANRRPDFIFCDDIQTRENALSVTESGSLYTWFLGTLLKARDMQRCLVIYVGNMYNEDCILYRLKMHPGWQSFITSAILPDLKPLWPDYLTIKDLLNDYEHDLAAGHPEIWFAEVMNIPVGGSQSLLPNGIIPASDIQYELPLAGFITIDPAGYRTNSDDNVIAVHCIYPELRYQVEEIIADVLKPDEVVLLAIDAALRYNVKYIFIETVAYQQILKWYFETRLEEYKNLKIECIDLKPRGRQKNTRISMFFNSLLGGGYSIAKKCRQRIALQAMAFKMDRKDNKDDILDCIAYGLDVKSQHQEMILNAAEFEDRLASDLGLQPRFAANNNGLLGVVENNSFLD